jgi:hypothetical protein
MHPSRFRFAASSILLFAFGCSSAATGVKSFADAADAFRQESTSLQRLAVGRVYVVAGRGAQLVLDIWADRAPDQLAGEVRYLRRTGNPERVLAVATIQPPRWCRSWVGKIIARKDECPLDRQVAIILRANETLVTSLADPFEVLEVFNRPVSGLVYNQRAEARVMQWRASLAELIAQHARDGQATVAMSTEIEVVNSGELVVRGAADLHEATTLLALLGDSLFEDYKRPVGELVRRQIGEGPGGEFRFELPKETVLRCEFRDISLVDESTHPRVDFRLGRAHRLLVVPESIAKGVVTLSE